MYFICFISVSKHDFTKIGIKARLNANFEIFKLILWLDFQLGSIRGSKILTISICLYLSEALGLLVRGAKILTISVCPLSAAL